MFRLPATPLKKPARWLEFLQEFRYKIKYMKGSKNVVADALSRFPINNILCIQAGKRVDQESYENDPDLKKIYGCPEDPVIGSGWKL